LPIKSPKIADFTLIIALFIDNLMDTIAPLGAYIAFVNSILGTLFNIGGKFDG